MPKLTIPGRGTFEVRRGTRLVRAIETSGVDILHRCGGWAKCTTCRVVITAGRPKRMTRAQLDRLTANGQLGEFDLSCQCLVERDMTVQPLMTLSASEFPDPGPTPSDSITPEAEWLSLPLPGADGSASAKAP